MALEHGVQSSIHKGSINLSPEPNQSNSSKNFYSNIVLPSTPGPS